MGEDLGEEFVLDLRQLFERGLERLAIFGGRFVDVFIETARGVVHQDLGIHQALGIVGEAEMDKLRVALDVCKGLPSMFNVAIEHLMTGDLSHHMDEFGVEEALLTRFGLLGAKLHLRKAVGVGQSFIDCGGMRGKSVGDGEEDDDESEETAHDAPLMLRGRLRLLPGVVESDEAVTGLPLLIGKFSGRGGQELFIQRGCFLPVVQCVVRGSRKEQGYG